MKIVERRRFLAIAGSAALAGCWRAAGGALQAGPPAEDPVYALLVRAHDSKVTALLDRQERDPSPRGQRIVRDDWGIPSPILAARFLKALAAAFCAPDSRFCGSAELEAHMADAARFLVAAQHPDGTIDFPMSNFHSPPDTAFVVESVALSLQALRTCAPRPIPGVEASMLAFLRAAGPALAVGGIHTPNHRWVVCSALARLNVLDPQPRFEARINEWLAEGIDIDPDGQFTERSTSVYSPIVDHALLSVARMLRRTELLDPVRRNLEMTLFYFHDDGGVATEGSRRQDQFQIGSPAAYYVPYRALALEEGNGRFAAAARKIEARGIDDLASDLIHFLIDPALKRLLPPEEALPEDFSRPFPHSRLVRIRRGRVSATILGDNPTFLSFRKGAAALEAVRLASAFFGNGQFRGDGPEAREGGRFILRQGLKGPYYQPLAPEHRRADGDWNRMDRSARKQSEVQSLETLVTISEKGGRFEIEINVTGTERVPVALELAFRHGGRLEGVTPVPGIPDAFLLARGKGIYSFQGQEIEFGPGFAEHQWTQLRGAAPKAAALSVYLTSFTPFRKTITLA